MSFEMVCAVICAVTVAIHLVMTYRYNKAHEARVKFTEHSKHLIRAVNAGNVVVADRWRDELIKDLEEEMKWL